MPEFTIPHNISYPVAADRIKTADESAKLAKDIESTARTTNQAITTEGAKAAAAGVSAASAVRNELVGGFVNPIELLPGADLYQVRETGWYFSRSTANSQQMTGLPPQVDPSPFLLHVVTTSRGLTTQEYNGYSSNAGAFKRFPNNASGTGMTVWEPLTGGGGAGTLVMSGASNTIYQQAMRDHYGTVSTEGKAAWALRIDHGLKNFNALVRPLLEARGIPYTLALNPGDWDKDENSGVTPATVNGWIANGPVPVEIINHGLHHTDASTPSMLEDYVIYSKQLLEEQLPAAAGKIFGFCQPGAGGSNYMGFNGGGSYESMANTYAGQLIFGNHAYATGHLTGTSRRELDGRIKSGMAHFTIDKQLVQRIKFEIDTAISAGMGSQMMLHPSLLNTADSLTTASLIEVLDYVVAKRNAGQLAVLSTYEMILARKESDQFYRISETVGRTVKVWDYLNNREQLIYGETGWRLITDLLPAGVSAANVWIKRSGNEITVNIQDLKTDAAGTITIFALPVGYRPASPAVRAGLVSDGTETRHASPFQGNFRILNLPGGTTRAWSGSITFSTVEPWPSSPLGTAVGGLPA